MCSSKIMWLNIHTTKANNLKKKKITNFYSKTGITIHTGNMINENVREPWKKYDLEPYIFY